MAKRTTKTNTAAKLAALDDVAAADPEVRCVTLAKALADTSPAVVRKAARLAAAHLCYDAVPVLLEAFDRFCGVDAVQRDPNCLAKSALAKALYELDHLDMCFYRRGLQLYQHEPVWGGSVDTAIDVRCTCALGLAATSYARAVIDLVSLLTDDAAAVRAAAVQALAMLEPLASEAVLRYKVLSGDDEPWVLGECFTALLKLEPEDAIAFVADQLDSDNRETVGQAALALGESRHGAALAPLAAAWEQRRHERDLPKILLQALALHRSEDATALLCQVIRDAPAAHAQAAVDALSEVRGKTVHTRILTAVDARPDPALAVVIRQQLEADDDLG